MSAATQWEQYVDAYHDFWDYLEEHEEILQKESNVTLVCDIMEKCPVVNFSCVRDLTYTMRQFLGEKRFKEKESQWKECLVSKIEECLVSISKQFRACMWTWMADLGVRVNSNIFPEKCPTIRVRSYSGMELCTATVQHQFTTRADHLLEKQYCLRELPDWIYNSQVYGQHIYRQQALILNINILRTFCHNLVRYYKVKPSDCGTILQRLVHEAFDGEVTCIQAADYLHIPYHSRMQTLTQISIWPQHEPVVSSDYYPYIPYQSRMHTLTRTSIWPLHEPVVSSDYYPYIPYHSRMHTLTRTSIWPLHEPVVSSYDDRKVALIQRWEDAECPKSIMPPIYTPLELDAFGEVISFLKTTGDKGAKEVTLDSIPHNITGSRHFARVMEIIQSEKYALNHYETDPTRKKNCLCYCVMFDPTVSPEAADQGYIGMTTRDPVTKWKEHVGLKDDSVIEYNLALVSQYAQLRGEDLSEYVAVFALGTTDTSKLGRVKGELIRETSEGGFTVGNMKYGMNDKRAAQKN